VALSLAFIGACGEMGRNIWRVVIVAMLLVCMCMQRYWARSERGWLRACRINDEAWKLTRENQTERIKEICQLTHACKGKKGKIFRCRSLLNRRACLFSTPAAHSNHTSTNTTITTLFCFSYFYSPQAMRSRSLHHQLRLEWSICSIQDTHTPGVYPSLVHWYVHAE
jgi:hypothetical protein